MCKERLVYLGNIRKLIDWDLDGAQELFEKAASSDIPYADGKYVEEDSVSIYSYAGVEMLRGNNLKAHGLFKYAFKVDPKNHLAAWNVATSGISLYCDGHDIDLNLMWKYYEYRFWFMKPLIVDHIMPMWDYKSTGSKIAVLAEQGHGDIFMFSRYLKYLREYFDEVRVQTYKGMEGLYSTTYELATPCDFYIPIGNLGRIVPGIPSGNWIEHNGDGNGIVCVWSGARGYEYDYRRSCDPRYFDKLLGKKYTIGPNPSRNGFEHLASKTWVETLQQLRKVGLVVTVDTAMAHLCGSAGIPCIVIMPLGYTDYRWGTYGNKNKWYESVRVVRNNGWASAIEEVNEWIKHNMPNLIVA